MKATLVLAALVVLVVLVVLVLFAGCVGDTTEFTLTGSQVVDSSGYPALRVRFTATGRVELRLIDPDGLKAGFQDADEGVTAVDLNMAGWYETAKPGTYTVIVEEFLGDQITTFTCDFDGCSGAISEVTLSWASRAPSSLLPLGYELEEISFKVTNSGDLPLCVYEGEVFIGGEAQLMNFTKDMILPGEQKAMTLSPGITGIYNISSGQHTLTLTLEDSNGKVVCSYNATVTPS